MPDPPRLLTVGLIAEQLSVPVHRVVYVLKTRRWIKPSAYAAGLRLYDRESLEAIRLQLEATANRVNKRSRVDDSE